MLAIISPRLSSAGAPVATDLYAQLQAFVLVPGRQQGSHHKSGAEYQLHAPDLPGVQSIQEIHSYTARAPK